MDARTASSGATATRVARTSWSPTRARVAASVRAAGRAGWRTSPHRWWTGFCRTSPSVSGSSPCRNHPHSTSRRDAMSGTTLRITLPAHPWCGYEAMVLGPRGCGCVWAELPDGRTCHLPLTWTDRCPRAAPLYRGTHPVRLSPSALPALAAWVAARPVTPGKPPKVALPDCRADNRSSDGVDLALHGASGRPAAVAVVGQARSSRARRPGGRRRPRKRGVR